MLRKLGTIAAIILFSSIAMAEEVFLRCRYFSVDNHFRIDLTNSIAWELRPDGNIEGQARATPDTYTLFFKYGVGGSGEISINRRTGVLSARMQSPYIDKPRFMHGTCEKEKGEIKF
jgi:hypothetical protein